MTLLINSILAGFGLTLLIPILHRYFKSKTGLVLSLYPLIVFVQLLILAAQVKESGYLTSYLHWIPSLGLNLTYKLDGLGLMMALLISGIGALVIFYGSEYLHGHSHLLRFYSVLILFMSSMLGLVISDNALLLFLFWELTSISSFLLIGFEHQKYSARAAAWQALLVTGLGGLALLAGIVLLGQISNSFEISRWISQSGQIISNPMASAALILILLGAMTKSAQFPFHFWLPNAMEAPTPVSAYLHSATMVKAGVFLLARLSPVYAQHPWWTPILSVVGLVTLTTSVILALAQTDLKKLLAYTTIAALGMITFLLGFAFPLAIKSAMVYLFSHALYKGALFLVAGGIDHATGSRDIRILGNLAKALPLTTIAACLATLSMMGIPPLIGFISKELVYESTLEISNYPGFITGLVLLANIIIVAVGGWVGITPFWKKTTHDLHPHEGSIHFWAPPLILAIISILVGIAPQPVNDYLINPSVRSVLTSDYKTKLALWHGLTPMLLLSIVTIIMGFALFALHKVIFPFSHRVITQLGYIGPSALYQHSLKALLSFATIQTRFFQNGYLRLYAMTIILSTIGLSALTFFTRVGTFSVDFGNPPRFYDVILIGIIIIAAVLVTRAQSRLATIALLGSIGFSIALIFLLYSAPDLAMVQFAIETLSVILFVLIIYRLPKYSQLSTRVTRGIDLIIALTGGILMTVLMLLISTHGSDSRLAQYFVENSEKLAFGRNVVNVILVDFRALDTLGEITVLAIAAIGVFSLIKFTRDKDERNPS